MMKMLKKNKLSIALFIAVLVLAGWLYHVLKKAPDYAGKIEIATPAPAVATTPMVAVPVKSVQVYSGGAATKKKLSLPASVVANDAQQVIASSLIDASDRAHTVTTVIDAGTGESETYVRTEPLPWLAYSSKGTVGIYYGLKNGETAIRLQARQDLIQVKAVRAGVIASFDQTAAGRMDTFVGVGVEYRW